MLDLWWWRPQPFPHEWCADRAHWLAPDNTQKPGSEALLSQLFRRELLSRYCGMEPAALTFKRGAKGKPYLVGSELQFSLSHGAGWHLLLVSDAPCGVDIEAWDRDLSRLRSSGALRRFAEGGLLDGANDAELLRCWTMKEAWAKSLGLSIWDILARPLERVDAGWRVPQQASGQVDIGACCSWVASGDAKVKLCKF